MPRFEYCIILRDVTRVLDSGPTNIPYADHQGRLFPHHEYLLVRPILGLFAKLQIEVPENVAQDEAHLMVRQALQGQSVMGRPSPRSKKQEATHFLPRQFRGPKENGCITLLLSSAKRESPVHLSGMNLSASLKLRSERYAA
jgi:hypothetical protein